MQDGMQDVLAYIDTNRARFVAELAEWVKIPSISSDSTHKPDMVKNAEFLMADLRKLGANRVEMWPTKGHPAVFAEWMQSPGKPTLLVYGHHDVQPVDSSHEGSLNGRLAISARSAFVSSTTLS